METLHVVAGGVLLLLAVAAGVFIPFQQRRAGGEPVPWTWWRVLLLLGFLALGVLLILWRHGPHVPVLTRWYITTPWLVAIVVLAFWDYVYQKDQKPEEAWFDKWTIIHSLAGVVFAVWFVPVSVVAFLAFGWEVVEHLTPLGAGESLGNRLVDASVALIFWVPTVLAIAGVAQVAVPIL